MKHKTTLKVSPAAAGRMATSAIAYAQEVEAQRDELLKLLAKAIALVSRCDIRQGGGCCVGVRFVGLATPEYARAERQTHAHTRPIHN